MRTVKREWDRADGTHVVKIYTYPTGTGKKTTRAKTTGTGKKSTKAKTTGTGKKSTRAKTTGTGKKSTRAKTTGPKVSRSDIARLQSQQRAAARASGKKSVRAQKGSKSLKWEQRSTVLVDSRGHVNREALSQIIKSVKDPAERAEIMAEITLSESKKERLTDKQLASRLLERDKSVEKMLLNVGYTPEEAAAEYGFDLDELINPENWRGNTFTFQGERYDFIFSYKGSIFVR